MTPVIRRAGGTEAVQLSQLALRSKGYWGYDDEFLEACRHELTVTAAEVETGLFYVAERDREVIGFYGIHGEPPDGELRYLFVDPREIGRGVGALLWDHALLMAVASGFHRLSIESDPFAESFYTARGAVRVGAVVSGSIPGRSLPLLQVDVVLDEAGAPSGEAIRNSSEVGIRSITRET